MEGAQRRVQSSPRFLYSVTCSHAPEVPVRNAKPSCNWIFQATRSPSYLGGPVALLPSCTESGRGMTGLGLAKRRSGPAHPPAGHWLPLKFKQALRNRARPHSFRDPLPPWRQPVPVRCHHTVCSPPGPAELPQSLREPCSPHHTRKAFIFLFELEILTNPEVTASALSSASFPAKSLRP